MNDHPEKLWSLPPLEDELPADLQYDDLLCFAPTFQFIYKRTGSLWSAATINAKLKPIDSGRKDEKGRTIWIKPAVHIARTASVVQMSWCPGYSQLIRGQLLIDGGWVVHKGVTIYNTYRPPEIVPRDEPVTLWLELIKLLYPADRLHIVNWFAHRIQRPGEKCNHCLVLGGAPRIGKDSILAPVVAAIGPWNSRAVTPRQAMGRFNDFLQAVMLVVSEARDLGEVGRIGFYDHMKNIIAAPPSTIRIDRKHITEFVIPNIIGVIMTTNYKIGGIYLPPDDGRHHVCWSDVTRAHSKLTDEYFSNYHAWCADGGNEAVAYYLLHHNIQHFNAKAPPRRTDAFWAMVDSNRAGETSEMADLLDRLGRPDAVTLDQLRVAAKQLPEPDFAIWLCDRTKARVIPHRLAECAYDPVRNGDADDGLWAVPTGEMDDKGKPRRKRMVIYARQGLTSQQKRNAAEKVQKGGGE
jgi:hypothetical protein